MLTIIISYRLLQLLLIVKQYIVIIVFRVTCLLLHYIILLHVNYFVHLHIIVNMNWIMFLIVWGWPGVLFCIYPPKHVYCNESNKAYSVLN